MAASTLCLSNTYLGAQFRRLKTKPGAPVAIKAMAAKLARLVYRMLRYGMQFVDRGADFYDAQHRNLQINYLKRKPPISDSKSSKLRQRSFWRSNMIIVGCDYHPGFQQIAFIDRETGECEERRLEHREAAEKFYRELAAQEAKQRVGMEASGHAGWFERLRAELNFELWIGDATEIARKRERKQETDRQDAQHILRWLLKDDFHESG
jgi:hypothetical protein